ncbi:MAG: radical SAM protein [Firmicutes bacterium]|jgi:MoaA/NifB/PqqE/SkfB family radical SAM enzyme|nr:radical SAM protein [Bacillota bacterium]
MNSKTFLKFSIFGIKTILFHKKNPILGTIILTDKCNLHCKHCSVNNKQSKIYTYQNIKKEMNILYHMGVRILFFCGGETFLWQHNEKTVRDLVKEAKEIGFLIVNVVTNGTFPIDLPEADLILLSLDGDRKTHNMIRGDTYDTILKNIKCATTNNICLYMAINQINKHKIRNVADIAKREKNIKAISFNFHTPYECTEYLQLHKKDKKICCNIIAKLKKQKYPIFNLVSAFPYLINNTFPTPCYQCVVIEQGNISICGRCIYEKGLCKKCGYFFVAEYTLLFRGNLKIILEMLFTYLKYI